MPQTTLLTAKQWLALPDPADKVARLCPPVSARKLRLLGCYCCRRCWDTLSPEGRAALDVAERYAEGLATDTERQAAFRLLVETSGGYIGPHPAGRPWCTASLTTDLFTRAPALVIATDAETLLRIEDGKPIADTFEDMKHIRRIEESCRMARWLAEDQARRQYEATRGAAGRMWDGLFQGLAARFDWAPGRNQQIHQHEIEYQATLVSDLFGNPFRPVAFSPDWRTENAVLLAAQMYESRDFSAMPILADALQDAGCNDNAALNHCRDPKAIHVRGCWVVDLVLNKA